jgi:DNA polymerase-1
MFGADFASLEDRISALTTKDPNKLKVYIDGYCGHCLRAYYYFGANMPDIVETVQSINSIKTTYPNERQESKAPTFALTYQGTWHTMVNNLGWSPEKAKAVEKAYHDMYSVSDAWVADKLKAASAVGYITTAFGLRVRTPILGQTILGNSATPYEAAAEGRTAGNALGQSYGLLNNRACIDFQERLLASPYKNDIKIIAMIHDAIYGIVKNNLGAIKWLNDNLPDCMAWQELPEIMHDEVKLSGEVDLFYPSWNDATTLPNQATKVDIHKLCRR